MNRRSKWNIDWKVAGWLFACCGLLAGCGNAGNEGGGTSAFFAAAVAGITFLASFVGGSVPMCFQLDRWHRLLETLTSVSAGFLVAAACLIVIPEGFERFSHKAAPSAVETPHEHEDDNHARAHSHHPNGKEDFLNSPTLAGLAILAGFLMMLITESLGFGHDIHEEHHDHSSGHVHHPESEGKRLATTVVIGLTIHAIADGMAIGAGLATGSHVLTGSLVVTLLTHKVPAAFSLTMFSQHAHGNRRRTWIDLAAFSLATPLAVLGTWAVLGRVSDQVLGIVLLFSAGTFIYVATIDVLPNVLQTNKRRAAALYVSFGCLTLLALIILLNILGFSLHDHG